MERLGQSVKVFGYVLFFAGWVVIWKSFISLAIQQGVWVALDSFSPHEG